jgi:hypothetical protein
MKICGWILIIRGVVDTSQTVSKKFAKLDKEGI